MDFTIIWTIIGTGLGTIIAIASITVSLWLHMDTKMDKFQDNMNEFRARMEKSDAEFKSHMRYYHSGKE